MRNAVSNTLTRMASQLGQNSEDALTKFYSVGRLRIVIQPGNFPSSRNLFSSVMEED